jgi:hypothetical protein
MTWKSRTGKGTGHSGKEQRRISDEYRMKEGSGKYIFLTCCKKDRQFFKEEGEKNQEYTKDWGMREQCLAACS